MLIVVVVGDCWTVRCVVLVVALDVIDDVVVLVLKDVFAGNDVVLLLNVVSSNFVVLFGVVLLMLTVASVALEVAAWMVVVVGTAVVTLVVVGSDVSTEV